MATYSKDGAGLLSAAAFLVDNCWLLIGLNFNNLFGWILRSLLGHAILLIGWLFLRRWLLLHWLSLDLIVHLTTPNCSLAAYLLLRLVHWGISVLSFQIRLHRLVVAIWSFLVHFVGRFLPIVLLGLWVSWRFKYSVLSLVIGRTTKTVWFLRLVWFFLLSFGKWLIMSAAVHISSRLVFD